MAERYRIDQRAALFGSRHGAKKAPVAATQIGAGQSQDAEALERQNEGHISELEARVSALKEITQSVGREVRESGSLIDSMNAGVAQAATTLRGTVSQLTQATSGRRDRTAALTGGFLLIFLIMPSESACADTLTGTLHTHAQESGNVNSIANVKTLSVHVRFAT
ncbi:unnamed protein product [Prorocentrum cordatum]|uniref:t-SNARE coiled-coil homology domain-containing protein n=1 Tax=Prorocentrum cordatum TaxID=2364126 RepID=A0ABN9XWC7_9DINO|nr:unnamed protein product [Polarella glacialis]